MPLVSLNGSPVRVVRSFKYLGHILTDDLRDDADLERERRALAVRCNMLARRSGKCSEDVKSTLFRAFCQCFYTCQLWVGYTKRSYNKLRVQYNDAFRILMKHPRYCSAKGMFADAGVPDFYAVLRTRIASFWDRLRTSTNTILKVIDEDPCSPFKKHWSYVHTSANVI